LITGATGSFASSGGSDTFAINHSSGGGIALNLTKGGNGEGLYINKTSGSGNAATIVGTLEATTLVKNGGTSSQFLKADGTVDSNTYALDSLVVHLAGTETITGAKTFSATSLTLAPTSGGGTLNLKQDAFLGATNGYTSLTSSGSDFAIIAATGVGTSKQAVFSLASLGATLRTYTLPDANGILALTSDIPSLTGYVTLATTQTITGIKTFSSFDTLFSQGFFSDYAIKIKKDGSISLLNGYVSIGEISGTGTSKIVFGDGNSAFSNSLLFNTSSDKIYTFPNASGTIALTTDLSGYLPLTGGTLTGALNGTSASFSSTVTAVGYSKFWNGTTGLLIGAFSAGAGYGALYSTGVTPSTTNFALATNGASTAINATNDLSFSINNTITALAIASTGAATFSSDISARSGTIDSRVFKIYEASAARGGLYPYNLVLGSGTDYSVGIFSEGEIFMASGGTATKRLTIASTGNVGIGVTPSAWYSSSGYSALQVGNASLFGRNSANSELYLSSNAYDNSSGNPTYITTDFAARYVQNDGVHSWLTAASGTAGAAITFTQAMTLTAAGNLGIGTVSPNARLSLGTGTTSKLLVYDGGFTGSGGNGFFAGFAVDYPSGNDFGMFAHNNGALVFGKYTNNNDLNNVTERMRITSGGDVGIGTASPSTKLQVTGVASTNSDAVYTIILNDSTGYATRIGSGISFGGYYDGTNVTDTFSNIKGFKENLTSGDYAGAMSFQTRSNGGSPTERMRITSGGNVIIGTTNTSTGHRLTVYSATETAQIRAAGAAPSIVFTNTDTNTISYLGYLGMATAANNFVTGAAAGDFVLHNYSGGPILFGINNSEKMRMRADGVLLIGTTTTSLANAGSQFVPNGETYHSIINSLNTLHVYDRTNSLYRFYVSGGGTVNATNTTISAISDVRLKENIVDLEIGLDAIMSLRPRQFDWKKESGNVGKNVRGFIAQEFEKIFPDLIDKSINPAPKGEEPYKQIRQDLIPTLVKAIQEQQKQIEELKLKIK
jgi:hypothetical protein